MHPRVVVPIQTYRILVMRSIYEGEDRPRRDLTARARILDAALVRFAEQGFERATIRGIAEAAGVSPGLVQHHFGSKEGLRQACDDAVLELVRRKLEAVRDDGLTNPGFLAALYSAGRPLMRYLARAAVESPSTAAPLLDEIVRGSEVFLSATWPQRFPPGSQRSRDAAAVLLAQTMGTIVLHEQVARQMGLDAWTDILSPRIGLAQLDVYEALGEYVGSGWGDRMREAVARYDTQTVHATRAEGMDGITSVSDPDGASSAEPARRTTGRG
jgi:AcrR family transcriptional regulator